MADTTIEWTDSTWNPVAGCTILTAGCTNCYAMRMAARLEAMGVELRSFADARAAAAWRSLFDPTFLSSARRVRQNDP